MYNNKNNANIEFDSPFDLQILSVKSSVNIQICDATYDYPIKKILLRRFVVFRSVVNRYFTLNLFDIITVCQL